MNMSPLRVRTYSELDRAVNMPPPNGVKPQLNSSTNFRDRTPAPRITSDKPDLSSCQNTDNPITFTKDCDRTAQLSSARSAKESKTVNLADLKGLQNTLSYRIFNDIEPIRTTRQFSGLQYKCTCKEPRTGHRYTNLAEDHDEACDYRTKVLPRLRKQMRKEGFTQ
jgi:hypothetical protein